MIDINLINNISIFHPIIEVDIKLRIILFKKSIIYFLIDREFALVTLLV